MQEAFRDTAGEENLLNRYGQNIKLIKDIIRQLREYVSANPFRNSADEIQYFKTQAPPFYSQYFYYNFLLNWELTRLTTSKERQMNFLEEELVRTDQVFERNIEFVGYCYMDRKELDAQLFTCQSNAGGSLVRDELELFMDNSCCVASITLARISANEQYRHYLRATIQQIQNPGNMTLEGFSEKRFEFDGTNTAAVELITSFSRRKLIKINGVAANTKTLAMLFESVFGRKLGNVYDIQHGNANRKKDPTPFLNSLIRAVTKGDFET